jgi:cytochrome c biogenesis protein CcmG, thiol:disulfide interchange protein DsbE
VTAEPPAPPLPRRPRLGFLVAGVMVAVVLGIGLFSSLGTPKSVVPVVGQAAPSFTLGRLGGGARIAVPADGGGGGKPVVLVFFASWCAPCQTEIPNIAAVYRHQPAAGRVRIIGIDGNDPTSKALAFVHRSGVTFPVAVDSQYSVTNGLYYFTGDPDAVFVNGDGTIAHIVRGPVTRTELVSWERRIS